MRHLLNTLFVTSEDIYLSLDGENVVASREHQEAARYPLHTLRGIVSFSYPGASPALMGACAERGISLAFCTPRGRFLARIAGSTSGNVLLRRVQYRTADEPSASCRIARSMIFGKVYNARWSIERTRRDHGLRLDSASLTASASHLKELLPQIAAAASLEHLRGLEGAGATLYFGQFDQLILGEKPLFSYQSRSRRPRSSDNLSQAGLPLVLNLTARSVTKSSEAAHPGRSEERRVGKECRSRWSPYH